MKLYATISLVFSVFAFQSANAAITLVQPVPTSIPSVSIPSFSLPSGVSIPSLSIPTSNPTGASLSSFSVTAFATVSVGGIASSDGATTYVIQQIEGVNGVSNTVTQTIVQGATVWREDALHETCSLDGKGGAVCGQGEGEFGFSFTGSAIPIFTVGADAAGAGGSGGGGASNSSGGGSAPSGGGAARVNGGAPVGWMLVGTLAAMGAGMRLVL
ncbi:hypothetical protein DFH08DRAFT_897498 [Mycena albidolilacea]|uniref:Uncharacterized protein n=1 Tax=Mycena albidolilacea TaxID=1033008 RepID=A0AAD6Z8P2_9AGAR|nr:hypothetical protein DFH08DRAFT_897498 [Mycena albidolilacea]